MARNGARRNQKVRAQKSPKLMADLIKKLRNDQSIDWEFELLGPRSLALDVLYLLGASISDEYVMYGGFKKFLDNAGISVDLRVTSYEGAGK